MNAPPRAYLTVNVVKVYKYGGKLRALLGDGTRSTIGIINYHNDANKRFYPEHVVKDQLKRFERHMRRYRKAVKLDRAVD